MTLLDNLVAYWKMNSATGLISLDSFGSHHGDLINMLGNEWGAGKIGNALTFDGINDGIVAPYSLDFVKQSFSVSLWIKRPSMGYAFPYIFGFQFGQSSNGFNILPCDGGGTYRGLSLQLITTTGLQIIYTGFTQYFNLGEWAHLVVTVGSGLIKFYINGASVPNSGGYTGTITYDGASLIHIGNRNNDYARPLTGSLDEIAYWGDRVLTQEDVTELYNSGAGKEIPLPSTDRVRLSSGSVISSCSVRTGSGIL